MLKIAGIQMAARPDKQANVQRALELSEFAITEGAKIVLLGELFSLPWFLDEFSAENYRYAEKIPGPSTRPFMAMAAKYKVTFICPVFEESDVAGIFYNTAVVIGDTGEIVGKYRKIHLPDMEGWREKKYFAKGDLGFPVFQTEWARFGILMCWDNFFPEAARILALSGAEIIFCPTTAAFDSHEIWQTVITANAICNNCYSFRLNRTGMEKGLSFYGKSFCASPYGELLFRPSTNTEGIIIAEVVSYLQKSIRPEWSFIKDRAVEAYLPLMPPHLRPFWR